MAFDCATGIRYPTNKGKVSNIDKLIASRGRIANNDNKWYMGFVADG